MSMTAIKASNIKRVLWREVPIPHQFKAMLRQCWHAKSDAGQTLCLIGLDAGSEQALLAYHQAGNAGATVEKLASAELAKERFLRVLSETTIIPRLW